MNVYMYVSLALSTYNRMMYVLTYIIWTLACDTNIRPLFIEDYIYYICDN